MSLLDAIDGLTLQGVATFVALGLSLWTFGRQELGKRAAFVTATCEKTSGPKFTETFVVIHNAGPAHARGVLVNFNADPESSPVEGGRDIASPIDIPAGHAARLRYSRSVGSYSQTLTVRWRDRRRGLHELIAPVNETQLPGAPIVNVTVEPISMDDISKGVAKRLHRGF